MSERKRIRELMLSLDKANRQKFPSNGRHVNAPETHGVYLISDHKNGIEHVGRTVRGRSGLCQRLNDHLQGRSSYIRACFAGDGNLLRSGYSYRYVEIPDNRQRALVEAAAIGWYCPRHLGLGAGG